jgi:hypothetical protein
MRCLCVARLLGKNIMAKIAIRSTVSVLCFAAIFAGAASVSADPVNQSPPSAASRAALTQKPAKKATASVNNQVKAFNAPASLALTNAAALSSFRVKYDNGDHALRSVNVAKQSDQTAGMWFSDSNPDDPITANGTWWVIPGATGGEISTTISSGEEFNIKLPAGPEGHRLVLGGFKVNIGGSTSIVENGEVQIGRLALRMRDPYPESPQRMASRISGTVFTNNGTRSINVMVQYVWVPSSYIARSGSVRHDNTLDQARASRPTTNVRSIAKGVGQMPSSERYLIQSFDLSFTNGTHNMLGMGVHLNGTDGAMTEAVTWQDNNRDDPINWNVSYLQMN